jgi:hypothetical protein
MTNINFDEPSVGEVTADGQTALKCINKGAKAAGVWGETSSGAGVFGKSDTDRGVHGVAKSSGFGVVGSCDGEGTGVWGTAMTGKSIGVLGDTSDGFGIMGTSQTGRGVFGVTKRGFGVVGSCDGEGTGVWGTAPQGIGIHGQGAIAGRFDGNVEVTGDIKLVNADCAEDFDIVESELKNVDAGTVMVLNENGSLQSSYQEYDKKVAGIISGASGYKPAIVLDRQQDQDQNKKNKDRLPIALMGKVYCKVDARHSSIEMGDLLTTSSTKGYAMKAVDPTKAFGAVIGKALGSIKERMGMIPVLVALQ